MDKPTLKQKARFQYEAREFYNKIDNEWISNDALSNLSKQDLSEMISLIMKDRIEEAAIWLGNNYLDYLKKEDKEIEYDPKLEADVDMVNENIAREQKDGDMSYFMASGTYPAERHLCK